MKKTIIAVFLILITLACLMSCAPHEHSYGTWRVTKQATCAEAGERARDCSCGNTITEVVPKSNRHTYGSWRTTTASTCTKTGVEKRTCNICGKEETHPLALKAHQFGAGKQTTAPSCTGSGVKTYTCTSCGTTKTDTISALGHNVNSQNTCTRCGKFILNMTSTEKATSNAVQYLSERQIWHDDDEGCYILVFAFEDKNEKQLSAPAVVDIRIVNDANETVYTATKLVKSSDFGTWTYNNGATKKYQASIRIYDNELTKGKDGDGDIYFTVHNDGYFSFSESKLSMSDLPKLGINLKLPAIPATIHHRYSYDNSIRYSVKITELTYKIDSTGYLNLYFSGEKTYDEEGNKYSRACTVGWKLYDDEGYVVDSGTFYSTQIAVGEKFRNERMYTGFTPTLGKTYTLVILDIG